MKVRMITPPSGTVDFGDGQGPRPWPAAGEEFEVADAEGARLCAYGMAAPVAERPGPETRKK